MTLSSIVVPRTGKIAVSHQTNLGVSTYDLNDLYSPDTAYWKSKVLDLASPKYAPNKNYIFDKSHYQNHGAITGATWVRNAAGIWVLNFDGDDYVRNTTANWRSGDSAGSLLAWIKTSTDAQQTIFSSEDEASTNYTFRFRVNLTTGTIGIVQSNNDTPDAVNGTTNVRDGKWHLVGIVSSGTAWSLYVDTTTEGLTTTSGSNTGDWFADTPNRDNFAFGIRYSTSATLGFTGQIALGRVFSPVLTATQFLNIYNHELSLFNV